MYHAVPVGVVERVCDFTNDLQGFFDRKLRLGLQTVAKRKALDVGHHIVEAAIGLARVEERQDVRMRKLRSELNLAQKALGADRLCDVWTKHLESHLPVVPGVVGQIHCRHSALTELALDGVVGEGTGDLLHLVPYRRKWRSASVTGRLLRSLTGPPLTA